MQRPAPADFFDQHQRTWFMNMIYEVDLSYKVRFFFLNMIYELDLSYKFAKASALVKLV